MADAFGDIGIAATGLKDPTAFAELIARYSFGSGGRTFEHPEVCRNGDYFACVCGELYPNVFAREVQGEEEHDFDEDAFVAAVQEHLTHQGRVVISCFYREKFRYMCAEKFIISKTEHEIMFLDTSFEYVQ